MAKTPLELTTAEWEEVRGNPTVILSWGLTPEDTLDSFKETVYAVKFDFSPQTMPNYRGEVILLLGDSLEPLVLVRDSEGTLVATKSNLVRGQSAPKGSIFITVYGGVATVEDATVPDGIDVEIIDLDDLKADGGAVKRLSPEARAYAREKGFL